MVNLNGDWNALHKSNPPIDEVAYQLPRGGWIYVLETSSDYERFKLGKANESGNGPFTRYSNLRTGDPYLTIHCAFFIPSRLGSAQKVESMLHEGISDLRIYDHHGSPTEWFQKRPGWGVEYICAKLARFAQQRDVRYRCDLPPDLDRVVFIYESDLRRFFGKSDSE